MFRTAANVRPPLDRKWRRRTNSPYVSIVFAACGKGDDPKQKKLQERQLL
jgi:hypothetical protein